VIFELYNEPYLDSLASGQQPWTVLQQGGTFTNLPASSNTGNWKNLSMTWKSAGMQSMVNAIRATGATNVILASGWQWSSDLSGWLANVASDPRQQLGAVLHAYPGLAMTSTGPASAPIIAGILKANYPVFITETGDKCAPGTVGSPFDSVLLPWADANGISYLGWTWDVWNLPNFVLIKDAAGTPTDGYGVYFRQHLLDRAAAGF
jgi:hypothetical protein